MGFSVTVSHVIFGIALIAALSTVSASYWKTQSRVEDARRIADDRAVEAAHTNLTITSVSWSAGPQTEAFTITNKGATGLDYSQFTYVFDGVVSFASQTAGHPLLNSVYPATSNLLLPGDTLDVEFALASEPTNIQVAAENGIVVHYPG